MRLMEAFLQPDITVKLKKNLPLTPYNRSTFYLTGEVATGYIDIPFISLNKHTYPLPWFWYRYVEQ